MSFDDMMGRLDILNGHLEDLKKGQYEANLAVREAVRGVKWMTREEYPKVNQIIIQGPEPGFIWDLKLISVQLSAATGGFDVFLGDQPTFAGTITAARRQIFNGTASQAQFVATWSSHQVLVFPDQTITLDAVAAAVNINEYYLTAVQVPAEMVGKLIS